jgi:hypothetical protein
MIGQRGKCLGPGEMGAQHTAGPAALDTAAEAMDMPEKPFKNYYDLWQPPKPLPADRYGARKRNAFLVELEKKHPDRAFMSDRQCKRWIEGSDMSDTVAKACADVLIGAGSDRAEEYKQFIASYGPKTRNKRGPAAAQVGTNASIR